MNMNVKQLISTQTLGESKNSLAELFGRAQEGRKFWKEKWMNLEVQATLMNTNPSKLIATMLNALREQLKENGQLNAVEVIVGRVPEIPGENDQVLTDGGEFWDDVNGRISARRSRVGCPT